MISKTIVETHGGSLSFTSRQGEGTTMSFSIRACVIGAEMSSTVT
ncbi:signal transduction histidine kinase [Arthrobacter sp. UYCu511]